MENMSYRYVIQSVHRSISQLLKNDLFLIERDVSEWAIAHRMAVYLETRFPEWDVDCEYNRQGLDGDGKRNADNDIVRPDITIHKRGLGEVENNLLVVEIKKGAGEDDPKKVLDYTSLPNGKRTFQYQLGLTLGSFAPDPREVNWYCNGAEVLQDDLLN